MFPIGKERFGCSFCSEHFISRAAFNTHLDTFLTEVTSTSRKLTAAPRRGSHFIPVIRAVRLRGKRGRAKDPVLFSPDAHDCCRHWRLFQVLLSNADVTRFQNMPRKTHADWAAAAHRFVEARTARDAHRLLRGCPDLDTESDADDAYVPRFVSINVNVVPQSDASGSSVRGHTNLLKQHYQRQVHSAVTNNVARGSTENAVVAPKAVCNTVNPARESDVGPPRPPKPAALQPQPPREIPPIRAPTPQPAAPAQPVTPPRARVKVETIDLTASTPRTPAPRTSIVVVRELAADGRLVMLRETTLAQAVEVVAQSLPGCVGLRDSSGVLDERRWRGRPLVMVVAVEWEW